MFSAPGRESEEGYRHVGQQTVCGVRCVVTALHAFPTSVCWCACGEQIWCGHAGLTTKPSRLWAAAGFARPSLQL